MYLLDNPVLQRELLVNLRMHRAFILLAVYMGLLGAVVYAAWPNETGLVPGLDRREAAKLVNLFFLGQYILISMMAPSFAAGSIAGEKERKTYEMILASPMRPHAIVLAKLLAAMAYLAVLAFCSLPIVMLCLPLGGVSLYEVLATYLAMGASVVTFGMISIACSAYFTRTVAALVVSYLLILPLALLGILFYRMFQGLGEFRLFVLVCIVPVASTAICYAILMAVGNRLMHPPDVGSEGQDVVDIEDEQRGAVGMVIRGNQFPDSMFAPTKRTDYIADGVNPVYDKEMRSEIFGSGTLMLRLVIQISMGLAVCIMAACLFIVPAWAPWYASYVLMINMLLGPVFAAGTITNERERQTLELLLTTILSPWKILSGKVISSLRVSVVLTCFVGWPLLLAWLFPPWTFLGDSLTMIGYLALIGMTCITTTTLATFFSLIFRRTVTSMMVSYLTIIVLFAAPIAVKVFADTFHANAPGTMQLREYMFVSPFAAAFSLPLKLDGSREVLATISAPHWHPHTAVLCLAFYTLLNIILWCFMTFLFNRRWRVSL